MLTQPKQPMSNASFTSPSNAWSPQDWLYPTPTMKASELVILDARLDDLNTLIQGVQAGIPVAILLPDRNGIRQITEILHDYRGLKALHIICHGEPGSLQLGDGYLTRFNCDRYTSQLYQWQTSFAPHAEILLYGCRVAAHLAISGWIDPTFLYHLQSLTGAAIAASSQPVGNPRQGGSWTLDVHTDTITTPLALTPQAQQSYRHLLASTTLSKVQVEICSALR